MANPAPVTALLRAWSGGDEGPLGQLLALPEAALRLLARACMARERIGHTLLNSAFVNDPFPRLVDARQLHCQDRVHSRGISARLMRRVLVDHASALRVSTDTVARAGRLATLWLLREMEGATA